MTQYDALAGMLDGLCDGYEALLSLENQKTELLVTGDADGLPALLNEQQAVLISCRVLEKKRQALCNTMGHDTLAALSESSPYARARFEPLHNRLKALVEQVKSVGGRNQKLLEVRLSALRHMQSQAGITRQSSLITTKA